MIEVPVYVPRRRGQVAIGVDRDERDERMGEHFTATVAPRSAIVGTGKDPDPGLLPQMMIVYYEGNLYGAANMITFADRAMFAYWRLRDHYPTAAMMAVPCSQVMHVANLYPEFGRVEASSGVTLTYLARWLELEADALNRAPEAIHHELAVKGVTIQGR
jgi:hypothetical protein